MPSISAGIAQRAFAFGWAGGAKVESNEAMGGRRWRDAHGCPPGRLSSCGSRNPEQSADPPGSPLFDSCMPWHGVHATAFSGSPRCHAEFHGGSGNSRANEGAFRAPFDSCFHAGQFSDQLSSGGCKSGQSIASILKSLFDRFRLGDELRVERRRHDVPAFFSLLKSKNNLPVTHRVLLHQDDDIRRWPSGSMAQRRGCRVAISTHTRLLSPACSKSG
jgi:hypothetical protein